ncbi:MAG: MFS transporter [Proteobacteria bacterium]|nr:MFS transporter [Pseudomonadota bacterium]
MPTAPPPDQSERLKPSRFLLVNLLCAIGFGLVAMTICLPSMPQWQGFFQAEQASVQLTFSSYIIAYGVAQVIYGPLSDRYGRKRLMLLGFFIAALGSLACAAATSLTALTLGRFVQGAGAAAGMVLGRAMVQDYFTGGDRARIMAYIGMVMGMCAPIATVVGGQLHVLSNWRANFVLVTALSMTLFLTTWLSLPRDVLSGKGRAHWLREMFDSYNHLRKIPEFVAYVGVLSLSTGTFYIYLAGAPGVFALYGVGPASIGFFIMVVPLSYIAGSFLTSRLIKSHSDAELMLAGQLVSLGGIATVLVLALADVASPLAIAAPLILLGIGQGLLMPSTLAGTVSVVPALAGAAAGAAGLLQQMSGAVGGYVIGLFHHENAVKLAMLMLLFMSCALACQIWLRALHKNLPHRAS